MAVIAHVIVAIVIIIKDGRQRAKVVTSKWIIKNELLYNFVIHDNSNNTNIIYGSNYLSLMLSERQQQQQSFIDSYTALILEGSK